MSRRGISPYMLAAITLLLLLAVFLGREQLVRSSTDASAARSEPSVSAIPSPRLEDDDLANPDENLHAVAPGERKLSKPEEERIRSVEIPPDLLSRPPTQIVRIFTGTYSGTNCRLQEWASVPELLAKGVVGAHFAFGEDRVKDGLLLLKTAKPLARTERERMLVSILMFGASLKLKDADTASSALEDMETNECVSEKQISSARAALEGLAEEVEQQ